MQVQEYVKPASLDEAYELLKKAKTNHIIGGCTFLRKINRKVKTAIDLSDCGLDYIIEEEDCVRIGAYTSLHTIETSPVVLENFGTMLAEAMEHLIGVQLRNMITIGGHMYSRFGFSDINTVMLALNAKIRLYQGGIVEYKDFMQLVRPEKDIMVEVILPKEQRRGKVQMMRTSYNDYSIFCLAVSRSGNDWLISAGVLPGRPKLVTGVMDYLKETPITKKDADRVADMVVSQLHFGSNYRGSAEYRRSLCQVFAKRAIKELADED